MRLFFAAFPDEETRCRTFEAAGAVDLGAAAQRVPAESYHMTLVFAGEVSIAQAAALRSLGPIDIPPFVVCFDLPQYWLKSQVVVIAASECPPALRELHCKLRDHLAFQGLAADPRPFQPHVTIARKVMQPPVFQVMSGLLWTVASVQLACSMRSDTGSAYTVIDRWQLLDRPASTKESL